MDENALNAWNLQLTHSDNQENGRTINNYSANSYKSLQGSWCQRRYCKLLYHLFC